MFFQIKIEPVKGLVLRDPEETSLGRNIVRKGLLLIRYLGFEQFTFKKLAENIQTTEASVYRYFENKHRLLLYLLTWYWSYMEYLVIFELQNVTDPAECIKRIIRLLVEELPENLDATGLDKKALYEVVIAESNKAYLIREVDMINSHQLFKPYKDLCHRVATLFIAYNPDFKWPHSLGSTLIETAHVQHYFMLHLPRLTDFQHSPTPKAELIEYLECLTFSALDSGRTNARKMGMD